MAYGGISPPHILCPQCQSPQSIDPAQSSSFVEKDLSEPSKRDVQCQCCGYFFQLAKSTLEHSSSKTDEDIPPVEESKKATSPSRLKRSTVTIRKGKRRKVPELVADICEKMAQVNLQSSAVPQPLYQAMFYPLKTRSYSPSKQTVIELMESLNSFLHRTHSIIMFGKQLEESMQANQRDKICKQCVGQISVYLAENSISSMLKLLQRIVELNLPNLNLEALTTKIHTLKIMNLDINDCIKGDQNLFVKFNKERITFEITTSDGHISPAAVISTFIDDLEDLLALFIEIESTLYSYVKD